MCVGMCVCVGGVCVWVCVDCGVWADCINFHLFMIASYQMRSDSDPQDFLDPIGLGEELDTVVKAQRLYMVSVSRTICRP